MTRVRVSAGACGLVTIIEAIKKDRRVYAVKITSDCPMVEKLGGTIAELSLTDAFTRICENPVYRAASTTLRHCACPVPSAILKALEVEAGLAVTREVRIEFLSPGDDAPGEET